MKTHIILCMLALLAVEACMAQTNQNGAAPADNSGVFISSYYLNSQTIYFDVVPGTNEVFSDILDWRDGQGGTETASDYADWEIWEPRLWNTVWPVTAWPVAPTNGILIVTEDGETYTNVINPANFVWEHCYVSNTPAGGPNQLRSADAKVRLATGGPLGSSALNLWEISATVTAKLPPWTYGGEDWTFGGGAATVNIACQNISILGQTLGSDGNLWVLLPDNTNVDVTPVVTGPNTDWYTYTVAPQKYKPFITANDTRLDHDRINVTNCVGQKIVFKLAFYPPLPDGVLITNQNLWWLPGNYVNASEWFLPDNGPALTNTSNGQYFLTTCDPVQTFYSRYAYNVDSPFCTFYKQSSWPLTQPETGAWWISDGPKAVTCFPNLTFNNGQQASFSTHGDFYVLKPQITSVVPGMYAPGGIILSNEVPPKLSLGGSAMHFDVYISKTYPGSFGISQLVKYYTATGYLPILWDSTDGDFWLDSSHEYYSGLIRVNQDSSTWPSNVPSPNPATIDDAPQGNLWAVFGEYEGTWKDYVRFTPDGNGSIPITLGRIDWNWTAWASITFSWYVTTNTVHGPTLDTSDDSPPQWIHDKPSPPGE